MRKKPYFAILFAAAIAALIPDFARICFTFALFAFESGLTTAR